MGTKKNPGDYDCYANAEPDEPMFVLLGRDDRAPALVEAWADASEKRGTAPAKVAEARNCAAAMRVWHRRRQQKAGIEMTGKGRDERDLRLRVEADGIHNDADPEPALLLLKACSTEPELARIVACVNACRGLSSEALAALASSKHETPTLGGSEG